VQKKRPRWRWRAPGKVALTSAENLIPYLDSTGPENQKQLAGPEFNALQAGRLMA
jgi:hypothetical protein